LNVDLLALQTRLGYRFNQLALLERALTHRSYSADHYERLEFLGDSVLSLAISGLLYERLTGQHEGELSRIRANLVKEDTLAGVATRLGVADVLRLGEGELRSGGQSKPSILADVLEAIIGAVYLDAGFAAAQALVGRLYQGIDINPGMSASTKDGKTALQEWLQARKMKLPVYRVLRTHGELHRQTFEVVCEIETGQTEQGAGTSRRAAEQVAAAALLQKLHQGQKK
jgi:ribonuclease III